MKYTLCYSDHTVKNGHSMTGKQKYKCHACHRQFVLNPEKFPVLNQTKDAMDKLLLERISLAGIARATGVSERWLKNDVNAKYRQVPRQVVFKKRVGGV